MNIVVASRMTKETMEMMRIRKVMSLIGLRKKTLAAVYDAISENEVISSLDSAASAWTSGASRDEDSLGSAI